MRSPRRGRRGSRGRGGRGGGLRRRHAHHCHPRRRARLSPGPPRPVPRRRMPASGRCRGAASAPAGSTRPAGLVAHHAAPHPQRERPRRSTTARRRPRCATARPCHPTGVGTRVEPGCRRRVLGLEEPERVVELTGPGVDEQREVDRARSAPTAPGRGEGDSPGARPPRDRQGALGRAAAPTRHPCTKPAHHGQGGAAAVEDERREHPQARPRPRAGGRARAAGPSAS